MKLSILDDTFNIDICRDIEKKDLLFVIIDNKKKIQINIYYKTHNTVIKNNTNSVAENLG